MSSAPASTGYQVAKRPLDVALDTTNSAQQGVPVPWFGGTRKLSVILVSTIYNPYPLPAKTDRAAKK